MIFIQKRDKCVSFIRHEKLHTVQTIWQLMLSLKMIAFCCLYTLAERDMWLITGNVAQNFKQEYLIVVKRLTS